MERLFRVLAPVDEVAVRSAHAQVQLALLGRIGALAETAGVEDVPRLTDAYLTIPSPGEDFPGA